MRKIFQYIIGSRIAPIFIILIGSFFAFIISVSSPKPQKGIELPKPTPVFYEVITKKDISLKILTNGEVKPLNEINLISQVSGQIVEAADEFVDGGIIKAGSPLVWIDDRDIAKSYDKGLIAEDIVKGIPSALKRLANGKFTK